MNLIRASKSAAYVKFARTMDWALAWASIPFAGYMFWATWPNPGFWAWFSLACIPVGFLCAYYDWQKVIEDQVDKLFHKRLVKRG